MERNPSPPLDKGALTALRSEIVSGSMRALVERDAYWDQKAAPHLGQPWREAPWFFAEAYLYRRIREIVGPEMDPFLPLKLAEEAQIPQRTKAAAASQDVRALLHAALWGNRGDLSHSSSKLSLTGAAADLLVDDTEQALEMLGRAARVHIILDNAGTELAFDLLLAQALERAGQRVVLHAKAHPFFVSDATLFDVERTMALMSIAPIETRADPFWTTAEFFFTDVMPSGLVDDADVVILKGDANYRRLVGDAPWPHDTPVDVAMDFPRPLIALRTCKAEVAVGVPNDVAARAKARDDAWLTSGQFGMVVRASCPHTE